MLHLHHFS